MEAGLNRSIDDKSYAEALQLYCEFQDTEWARTAQISHYICEVNRDPKKGSASHPRDFNPWSSTGKSLTKGIPLKAGNFSVLKGLTQCQKQ